MVQYRSPVRSIVSNYYLFLKRRPDRCTVEHWKTFALERILHWNHLVDKWVLNFPADRGPVHYCPYEELLADPKARIRDVLAFTSPDPIDEPAMALALMRVNIAPRDNLAAFEFYDAAFFESIEAYAGSRLRDLGLPSFRDGV